MTEPLWPLAAAAAALPLALAVPFHALSARLLAAMDRGWAESGRDWLAAAGASQAVQDAAAGLETPGAPPLGPRALWALAILFALAGAAAKVASTAFNTAGTERKETSIGTGLISRPPDWARSDSRSRHSR